jgi:translation initiation factor 1
MAKEQDWKKRLGVVYSTSENFEYQKEEDEEDDTLPPQQQLLYIYLDTKQRKGKAVTIIEGFVGKELDLEILAKKMKSKCGVGGSAKDGLIILQGDWKIKSKEILEKEGFKTKFKGG